MNELNVKIKNFGPIQEVDVQLKRLNILIGDNCTGKSTIVKCVAGLFNFKIIVRLILDMIINENNKSNYREIFDFSLKSYDLLGYKKDDGSSFIEVSDDEIIVTHCNQCSLSLQVGNQEARQQIDNIKKIFKSIIEAIDDSADEKQGQEKLYQFINTLVVRNDIFNDILYIPAERDILLSVTENPMEFFKNYEPSQYLIDYAKLYNEARKHFKEKEIPVFNYKYTFDDNRKTGILTDATNNVSFSLNEASSGLKSLLPIILLLEYIKEKKQNKIIIIEEPEISLFPEKQDLFARYLAEYLNQNPNVRIVITTHSPYLLFSFTNLAYAHYVANKGKEKEVLNLIKNKNYLIDPAIIKAYLLKDGECRGIDILEDDFYSISEEELVNVSDNQAMIYNQLHDLIKHN